MLLFFPLQLHVWGAGYFETMQISSFCLNFYSTIPASVSGSWLKQLLLSGFKGVCPISSFYVYSLEVFCRKSYHFDPIYVFIHLCICASMGSQIFILGLGYNLKNYLFVHLFYVFYLCYLFCCLSYSNFGHWELFQVSYYASWICPIFFFFLAIFIFWQHKMPQAYLMFSCPSSGII